jgi:hypothetical protein
METPQQRVRAHDQYQIEFKREYELLPAAQARYKITTYLFIPQSLGIQESTYPKHEFYRDIQNYVRLKTPVLPLPEFCSSPASPLLQIEQLLQDPHTLLDPVRAKRLSNTFKFLRAMLKSSLRYHLRSLKRLCTAPLDPVERTAGVARQVNALIDQTHSIVGQYRSYRNRLQPPQVTDHLHQAYHLTDESISLVVEESLVDLFRLVHKYLSGDPQAELEMQINAAVERELAYRQAAGYGAIMDASGNHEAFLFRSSVLKKFTSSVLYLALVVKREGTVLEQILFAVAAGLSMVFATAVAFYFQAQYGQLTLPFFAALIIGYMFKDRIKETGRLFFAQHLSNWLYDRRILVKTLDGEETLGYLREKVTFLPEAAIPPAIMRQRNRNLITELDNEGQGEHVLCYTKEVVLRAHVFAQLYAGGPPLRGITDIMRLDVRPYLRKMDDPVARWFHLHAGKLQISQAAKVYYLNFVSAYTIGNGQAAGPIERTQVTLTRNGIQRVEHFV